MSQEVNEKVTLQTRKLRKQIKRGTVQIRYKNVRARNEAESEEKS